MSRTRHAPHTLASRPVTWYLDCHYVSRHSRLYHSPLAPRGRLRNLLSTITSTASSLQRVPNHPYTLFVAEVLTPLKFPHLNSSTSASLFERDTYHHSPGTCWCPRMSHFSVTTNDSFTWCNHSLIDNDHTMLLVSKDASFSLIYFILKNEHHLGVHIITLVRPSIPCHLLERQSGGLVRHWKSAVFRRPKSAVFRAPWR